MHPNPAFRGAGTSRAIALARERGFGVLAVSGRDGPLISHVPFFMNRDGTAAGLHLVRSNPLAAALGEGPLAAVLAVSGPDSYVSPDWYGIDGQVPTWNYVAVHLRGQLSLLPQDEIADSLDRLATAFERRLAPKAPWTADKLAPEALARLTRAIVPCRLAIGSVDSTFKLSQNKPDAARLAAADALAADGIGQQIAALAGLMRNPPA